ncbi:MAG: twin-arginine translocase subunit TatB [Alphaproteobacteria bacterium]|nr:twin-arginine translocase subunit TatB [Alphaproteobacteria bacterium]
MFDIGWSELLVVLVVALVVVGPKDLPRLARMAGQWMARARAMADQFRKSFDEMARQAELEELRSEIQALRSQKPMAELERRLDAPSMGSILPPEPTKPVIADPDPEIHPPTDIPAEAETPEPVFEPGDKPPAP